MFVLYNGLHINLMYMVGEVYVEKTFSNSFCVIGISGGRSDCQYYN